MATQYANNAKDSLKKWKARIVAGEFMVHTVDKPDGNRATTLDALYGLLTEINKKKFVSCLESSYNVIPNMYTLNSLKQGVECAFNEKTAGTFQSGNSATKLETALDGAWKVPEYWISKPHLLISKIKVCVDEIINDGFQNGGGRVSIKKIYDVLKAAPYGFMPCNLSAFILGFVLKEYASGKYSWSDGLTNDVLNVNKLKEMIDEVIRLEITPNSRYKDKYIVIVDVQNHADLDDIMRHYKLPQNVFLCASDTEFCKADEFPIIPNILERLANENSRFFVSEISSFFMLKGEKALVQELKELLSMSIAGHAVILTFQCAEYLRTLIKNDRRVDSRVCILDVVQSVRPRPRLVFTEEGIKLTGTSPAVKGLRGMAKAVESTTAEVLYIETHKSKDSYPFSLYSISDLKNPYEILCHLDGMTAGLVEGYGSKEEWQYALGEFQEYPSWQQLIFAKIGSIYNLDIVISTYQQNSTDKKWLWLYFIGLKLFHAGNDSYLNKAIEAASSPAGLVHNLYRTILEVEPTDSIFASIYFSPRVVQRVTTGL